MAGKVATAQSALDKFDWDPFADPQSPLSATADPKGLYGWDGSNFDESMVDTLDIGIGDV